jgi:hypothetical protein
MHPSEQIDKEQIRSIISAKFIEPGFDYWFTNHEHVRSPFPPSIRISLKEKTSLLLFEWIDELQEADLKAMKEDEFVEMFETILFNEAMKLVDNEDQQLTISYPFLPRLGDLVNHQKHGKGNITGRKEIVSKENRKLFELAVLSQETGITWETQFELPD